MEYTELIQIAYWFLMYSLLGWVVEVIYHAVTFGKIVNRGFLNGPVCPVYGFGAVVLLVVSKFISTDGIGDVNIVVVFFAGMLLATLVELIAGWLLDKAFHARWWDYSNIPFNFHGYICLKFSIFWGIGSVIVARVVHPMVANVTAKVTVTRFSMWLLVICYIIYFIDFAVTSATMMKINKKLKRIDEISGAIRGASDKLTEGVGTSALKTTQIVQTTRVQAKLASNEVQDVLQEKREDAETALREKRIALEKEAKSLRDSLSSNTHGMFYRMVESSPTFMHDDYQELVQEIKDVIEKHQINGTKTEESE